MRLKNVVVAICVMVGSAAAQPTDDARKAADEAKKHADDAKASADRASKNAIAAEAAQAKTEAALDDAKKTAAPAAVAEDESVFEKLQFLGNANLIGGSLTTEDGETLASGGIGVYAQTKRWSLVTAFTFGSDGTSEEDATRKDYVEFLRSPTSAVGGQVQVRYLHPLGKHQVVHVGGSINMRVNVKSFSAGGTEDSIKLLAIDPSFAVSILFSKQQDIRFLGEVGLGLRFWNKPGEDFVDALALPDDSHIYAGTRVVGALTVSNIYVGVEVTRYGGGELYDFEEFAIVPYVGIRGGLEVFDNTKTTTEKKKPDTDSSPPPSIPLM